MPPERALGVPELPDVELYLHALRPRVVGRTIDRVRIAGPSLVRTFDPPVRSIQGRAITAVTRLGKRVVWSLDNAELPPWARPIGPS